MVSVSAHSAGAYTATLYVMVAIVKGVGVHPPPIPAWANFSIIMKCTPESSRCHSVCTLRCLYSHLCSESMVTSRPGRSVLGMAPGTPPRGAAAPAGRSSGQTPPAQPHPTSPHTCTITQGLYNRWIGSRTATSALRIK